VVRHRFAVGQRVRLNVGLSVPRNFADTYLITGMLPERDNSPQYRIRSESERHERVATEDSLEPVEDSAAPYRTTAG